MKQKRNLYLRLGLKNLEQTQLDPRDHFELGIQYNDLGYFAEAIPHLERAIEHGIDSGLAELHLGLCCSRLGRFAEARQHLLRTRETRPDSAELYCELGLISLKEGLLEDAKSGFEKALRINPLHAGEFVLPRIHSDQSGRME
jgi:tetratricopeptide (TPR) repeat protein